MTESAGTTDLRHPVAAFADAVGSGLDGLADRPLWSLGPAEAGETLVELTRLRARLTELEMRVAGHAEAVDVAAQAGATTTAAWWAHQVKMTRPEASRLTRLAVRLDAHPRVREALAAGGLLVDQAAVIIDAVEALPGDLTDSDTRTRAETYLLAAAAEHDAAALRILGRRILDIVAPEIGEAHESRVLEDQERQAAASASFTMSDDGQGRCHGRFTIPALHGHILRKHLMALAAPRHRAHAGEPVHARETPTRHRMGQAFCEYIESRREDTIGDAGGVAATVVVTMDLDTLTGGLAAAALDTGHRISAGEARRLACSAGIIPAVLGGPSEVLDLGRKCRFHTRPQRVALALRDGGCSAEGCDWPPGMCHVHHDQPWSRGGSTDVKTGRLLCPRHHTLAHDPRYTLNPTAHGKLGFILRT